VLNYYHKNIKREERGGENFVASHSRTSYSRIPSTKEVTIFFEGRQIIAHEGDTVASALIANGIDVLRESMNLHRPRGLFCAIGNCSSCLMVINGVPTRELVLPCDRRYDCGAST